MNANESTNDDEQSTNESGPASPREAMAEAGPSSDVPDGAIASVSDFAHERDERGDLLPVAKRVPGKTRDCPECGGSGEVLADPGDEIDTAPCGNCQGDGEVPVYVRVKPITQGEANRFLPGDGDISKADDEQILRIIKRFVVEPDFSGVSSLDDFTAFGVDPLLMAIMDASGFDMARGTIVENSELAEAVEGNSSRGN